MARKEYREFREDFKKEAVSLALKLGSNAEAAKQLKINASYISQWRKKFSELGSQNIKTNPTPTSKESSPT